VQANFRELAVIAQIAEINAVDGILFDLGLSSYTLESTARGFSFQRDEPLDMRFDPTRGTTAAGLLAGSREGELRSVLQRFGEEPAAGRVARALVRARQAAPLRTTRQLSDVVTKTLGGARGRVHPATRTFQALRIAVNDELGALESALSQAADALRPVGWAVARAS